MQACFQNLFQLNNKVVVVTGAAGILGSTFCKALCSMGAKVACLDLYEENLAQLSAELLKEYDKNNFLLLPCDVSNPKSATCAVEKICKHFSHIDILLNNAATKTKNVRAFFTDFCEYSLETWDEVMSVNLDGMFLMAQAVGKKMLNRKQGVILQTASVYSLISPDQRIYEGSDYLGGKINTPAVYTASKAGVIGLTKHLATLWGGEGIRVNALCPGGVSSGQNGEFNKKYAMRVPMGRMAEPIDMVGPVLFLVSDAARYITGQVLYVDGGLSAW
ncbi:MAG: short-chain dehydrogenase [Gammaproteobacteria bacterium RIFCSPHIGHO2_12_FULL_38_14]|nr:MAG: short-chain dehydrogenase [Gammaproteobacteria bacterium RIFCSPHIGHO2_12_FULL_38_14]